MSSSIRPALKASVAVIGSVVLSLGLARTTFAQSSPELPAAVASGMNVGGFLEAIFAKFHQHWHWQGDPKLNARFTFTVKNDGKFTDFRFDRSSNDPKFDAAIKKMLEESQPLPKPPYPDMNGVTVNWPDQSKAESKK